MDKKITVLIFPAGEVNSIELHDALCANVNVEVIGASSVDRHGSYVFEKYFPGLPMISDPAFIDRFNELLDRERVDLIFPTHDTVALYLAENSGKLHAKVVTASAETAHICRDKKAAYELFREEGFCPRLYPDIEKAAFPCFIKPREGQGSVGARRLDCAGDIPQDICWDDYVITQFLPGGELTVDCLTDGKGRLCAALPRSRDRLFAGISAAGTALPVTDEIWSIADAINRKLEFLGLWYFQVKQDESGAYRLLEISARCAGTMCLSRARGVNLPLLSVYAAIGRDVEVFENPCGVKVDRILFSRYRLDYEYSTVYIDYDDTIIVRGAVCLPVIRFLYQCRNRGKRVVLLSRHSADHEDTLADSLRRYAISPELFDSVIEVGPDDEKAGYMEDRASVFIDNAYAERKKVHDQLGIPVFDVDGVEVLTDWTS